MALIILKKKNMSILTIGYCWVAAIAGGAEAAICDKPLWKHQRRLSGVQKLQFVINLSGSTKGDGFIECCRGSKRRIKEGVKSLSCNASSGLTMTAVTGPNSQLSYSRSGRSRATPTPRSFTWYPFPALSLVGLHYR